MPTAVESLPAPSRPYIPNRLLDIDDVARLAHVSTHAVREWVRVGKVPKPIRIGRLLRWEPQTIETWIAGA